MSDLDLARRAVACAGWRNLDGTLDTLGARLHGNLWHLPKDWDHRAFAALDYEHLPDLSDPATIGCVIALVAEHRKARPSVAFDGRELGSYGPSLTLDFADGSEEIYDEDTLAECLIAALEEETP